MQTGILPLNEVIGWNGPIPIEPAKAVFPPQSETLGIQWQADAATQAIIGKLDSMHGEAGITFNNSDEARAHLKKLMNG